MQGNQTEGVQYLDTTGMTKTEHVVGDTNIIKSILLNCHSKCEIV